MSHKLKRSINDGLKVTDDTINDFGDNGESPHHGKRLGTIPSSWFHYMVKGEGRSDSMLDYLVSGDSSAYRYFAMRAKEHEADMERRRQLIEEIDAELAASHVEGSDDPGDSLAATLEANQRVEAAKRNRKSK